jgi:mRNA-degrading endonuclease RelE of RelBE toxin-antitoxin system
MRPKFEVVFLEQAIDFMASLDPKTKKKVYYNIDKAKLENDPKLFKKLSGEFGSFGQNTMDFNIGFSPFGTKRTNPKHSCYRLTEL